VTLRERNRNEHRVNKARGIRGLYAGADRPFANGWAMVPIAKGSDKSGGLVRESERGKALWL
jgi:hypothetical protein